MSRAKQQQDLPAAAQTRRKPLAPPPSFIIHFSCLMEQIHVTFKYTPFSYFGLSPGTRAVFRVCRAERRNKMMAEARERHSERKKTKGNQLRIRKKKEKKKRDCCAGRQQQTRNQPRTQNRQTSPRSVTSDRTRCSLLSIWEKDAVHVAGATLGGRRPCLRACGNNHPARRPPSRRPSRPS